MQFKSNSSARRRIISLTPLIDVVFILLLFFMLATNFQQWRSLTLNAPGPSTGNTAERALLLRIRASGELELSGQVLTRATLPQHLQPYLQRDAEQAVVVQPDLAVSLQMLVTVFDTLVSSGVHQITLAER